MMSWPSVTFATLVRARMEESAGPALASIMNVGVQQASMDQNVSTELMPVMEIPATMAVPARCLRLADMRKLKESPSVIHIDFGISFLIKLS